MNDLDLLHARRRLLKAGVAPRHVRRLVRELRDHRNDLEADSAGAEQLGSVDSLVAATLERRELRALSHRAPWLVYVLSPLLAFPLLAALVGFGITAGAGLMNAAAPATVAEARRLQGLLDVISICVAWGPPLIIIAATNWLALRRHMRPWWPLLGLALIAFLGAASGIRFEVPPLGGKVTAEYAVGYPPGFESFRGLWLVLLALVPYSALLWARRRHEAP